MHSQVTLFLKVYFIGNLQLRIDKAGLEMRWKTLPCNAKFLFKNYLGIPSNWLRKFMLHDYVFPFPWYFVLQRNQIY